MTPRLLLLLKCLLQLSDAFTLGVFPAAAATFGGHRADLDSQLRLLLPELQGFQQGDNFAMGKRVRTEDEDEMNIIKSVRNTVMSGRMNFYRF
jgi:hypothetical protein